MLLHIQHPGSSSPVCFCLRLVKRLLNFAFSCMQNPVLSPPPLQRAHGGWGGWFLPLMVLPITLLPCLKGPVGLMISYCLVDILTQEEDEWQGAAPTQHTHTFCGRSRMREGAIQQGNLGDSSSREARGGPWKGLSL